MAHIAFSKKMHGLSQKLGFDIGFFSYQELYVLLIGLWNIRLCSIAYKNKIDENNKAQHFLRNNIE